MYDAIDGYDPDTGNKFLTYANWHIRQRMQRYISDKGSCLRLPVHRLESIHQHKKFCNQFMIECGRPPSERETAYYMGITEQKAKEIKDITRVTRLGSLDSPVTGSDGGEDIVMGDLIADPVLPQDEVIEQVQQEQLKAKDTSEEMKLLNQLKSESGV